MLKAVSLFSGCGGGDIGISAYAKLLLAVEIDRACSQFHQINLPGCPVLQGDIQTLSGIELRSTTKLSEHDEIDIVFCSPPCQSFSNQGKRDLNDPRAKLLLEGVRLILELEPRYFVLENVKGLTTGRCLPMLEAAIELLRSKYNVLDYRVLNAKNYGVPQSRERLILLGGRYDRTPPKYPTATTNSIVSVRDAIGDLPEASQYKELEFKNSVIATHTSPSCYAETLVTGNAPVRELTQSRLTRHQPNVIERFSRTPPNTRDHISRCFKLDWKGVSPTLKAGVGSFTTTRPIHPERDRVITVRESARLQGFPDDFYLPDNKIRALRMIGNSIPPPLTKAITKSILYNCY